MIRHRAVTEWRGLVDAVRAMHPLDRRALALTLIRLVALLISLVVIMLALAVLAG